MWDLECSGTAIGRPKCETQTEILIGRHKYSSSTEPPPIAEHHSAKIGRLPIYMIAVNQGESTVMETYSAHVPSLCSTLEYYLSALPFLTLAS